MNSESIKTWKIDSIEIAVEDEDNMLIDDEALNEFRSKVRHRKDSDFNEQTNRSIDERGNDFNSIINNNDVGSARSIEECIWIIRDFHEEAQEDNAYALFREYANLKNMYLNLDGQTAFAKGCAMVEYELLKEAKNVLDNINGQNWLGHHSPIAWAFIK